MTNEHRELRNGHSISMAIVLTVAALLLLLGTVLQLGDLGFGQLSPSSFWLVRIVIEGIWNALVAISSAPVLQELRQFWPLLLVSLGLALLLATKSGSRSRVPANQASECGMGENHGR